MREEIIKILGCLVWGVACALIGGPHWATFVASAAGSLIIVNIPVREKG